MDLGYPSAVYTHDSLDFRKEFDGKTPNEDAATYIYEFPDTDSHPAFKIYWYEGGRMPKLPEIVYNETPEMKEDLSKGGIIIVGSENTILSPGMRPTSPKLIYNWEEIKDNLPEKKTPRAVGTPVQEIMAAIRGEIPACSSNFDYAAPLTEKVILGTIAIRSGKKVIFDPDTMTFSDRALDQFVKEPVREGWEYGENG
jgi:hypothetical protein